MKKETQKARFESLMTGNEKYEEGRMEANFLYLISLLV